MESDKLKPSRVIGTVSRHAGVLVGTAAAIGKKIAGVGVSSMTAAKDLFSRPVCRSALVSELEGVKYEANEAKDRKNTVRGRVAALESDLAAAQRELEQICRPEEYARFLVSSDVGTALTEARTTLSDLGREKVAVAPAVARPDEETKEHPPPPGPPEVTLEKVRAAVFPNSAESVIFTRAFSDITSPDAAVRIDAVRAISRIRHKLSVRVLVVRMAREPSARVRQECIKALTSLDAKESLSVVEDALGDRAALVRLAAVWGLYHLAGTESASALARMYSDEDEEVRRRAATCIGWLGREEFAVELLTFLDDGSVSVRRAAVEAMGTLGSRQVVSVLIEHLDDPAKSVTKAILGALKAITGKKMSGPLPRNQKALQCLIARWRQWWKEVYPG
ncbi:MAG: HEAT repeat domain-containing protein [Planctomycetota bacterium]|jgi:hypothetical protein